MPVLEKEPDIFSSQAQKWLSLGGKIDEYKEIPGESGSQYDSDGQYLFMEDWLYRNLIKAKPSAHTDIGSPLHTMFLLSNHFPVDFIDIRDPGIFCKRFRYIQGDIVDLPLEDSSIDSLSCLHVAEHIGLGRYGDAINPDGFEMACSELSRVLAPGGILYFAVPMGHPKVVFNAHRIIDSRQVLAALNGLSMMDFGGLNSQGKFWENIPEDSFDNDTYACGLFRFKK